MLWEESADYTSHIPNAHYMGNPSHTTEAPTLTLESLAADEHMMDVTMSADEMAGMRTGGPQLNLHQLQQVRQYEKQLLEKMKEVRSLLEQQGDTSMGDITNPDAVVSPVTSLSFARTKLGDAVPWSAFTCYRADGSFDVTCQHGIDAICITCNIYHASVTYDIRIWYTHRPASYRLSIHHTAPATLTHGQQLVGSHYTGASPAANPTACHYATFTTGTDLCRLGCNSLTDHASGTCTCGEGSYCWETEKES
ncbi:hypothetical protein HK097_002286 [Rhizophlyctis rosea]|uniref:Uncharacterized protein n=1 Tax=Rhizophlyctis rosea TaxID=64517 RepID=A0AAD5X1B3_9FUNG|nr:hypothetical protein HK097_002286 [Rhizophlyctis rosea]